MNCGTSNLRKKGDEPYKWTPKNRNETLKQESNSIYKLDLGSERVSPRSRPARGGSKVVSPLYNCLQRDTITLSYKGRRYRVLRGGKTPNLNCI